MSANHITLQGPKVHAERGETADAGGGQVIAADGELRVQGPVAARRLGELDQLGKIQFQDHRGRRSEWTFADGTRWTLSCETDELLAFSQALLQQLGRPNLVSQPPPPSEQWLSTTRERRSDLLWLAAAVVLLVVAKWLVGLSSVLGYVLAVLGLVCLGASATGYVGAQQTDPESPPQGIVAKLAELFQRVGPVAAWALPVCLVIGALLGLGDAAARKVNLAAASERSSAEDGAAQNRVEAKAPIQPAERHQATVALRLSEAQAAFDDGEYERAKALLMEVRKLDPEHADLESAWERLTAKLQAARRATRERDVVAGLAVARAVVEDPVRCDTAKEVGDAWAMLRPTTPEDETYQAAKKVARKLEQCRRRVVRHFRESTGAARAQARVDWASRQEVALRKAGLAASVSAEGPRFGRLVVRLASLRAEVLAALQGDTPTLGERAAEQGFRRLELRAGRKRKLRKLKPKPDADLQALLATFDLDEPLAL